MMKKTITGLNEKSLQMSILQALTAFEALVRRVGDSNLVHFSASVYVFKRVHSFTHWELTILCLTIYFDLI
jgi:hypothetical protein